MRSSDGPGPSPLQRSNRSAVTGEFPEKADVSLSWETGWAEVAPKARAVLLRRGAPASVVDDAIQTAGERSLRRREPFDGIQGWTNWTIKVAWHEVQAEWRRQARVEAGAPQEQLDRLDPALVTEYRLELAAVALALPELKPSDRAAALAGLDDDANAAEPLSASEKMRRYRARRRLAALVAGTGTPQSQRSTKPGSPNDRDLYS